MCIVYISSVQPCITVCFITIILEAFCVSEFIQLCQRIQCALMLCLCFCFCVKCGVQCSSLPYVLNNQCGIWMYILYIFSLSWFYYGVFIDCIDVIAFVVHACICVRFVHFPFSSRSFVELWFVTNVEIMEVYCRFVCKWNKNCACTCREFLDAKRLQKTTSFQPPPTKNSAKCWMTTKAKSLIEARRRIKKGKHYNNQNHLSITTIFVICCSRFVTIVQLFCFFFFLIPLLIFINDLAFVDFCSLKARNVKLQIQYSALSCIKFFNITSCPLLVCFHVKPLPVAFSYYLQHCRNQAKSFGGAQKKF